MMQLLCDGVCLDLPSGASLTFQKVNPLFAFDSISCERTASFDLPATPTNNRVFSLSKDPAFRGEGMRKRFPAQLQNGACVKDGYLYVDSYSGGKYKAIFVTGELVGLQKVKDAGKLAEITDHPEKLSWTAANAVDANTQAAREDIFKMVRYKSTFNGVPFPSVNVYALANRCAQALGVSINGFPDSMKKMRMLPPELNGFTDIPVKIKSTQGVVDLGFGDVAINTSTSTFATIIEPVTMGYNPAEFIKVVEAPYPDSWWWHTHGSYQSTTIAGWKANTDIDIRIPDDLPDSWCMVSKFFPSYSRQWENWQVADFYGNYYGTPSETTYGTPLKGRTIRVNKNEVFAFVNMNDVSIDDVADYDEGDVHDAVQFVNNGTNYMGGGQPTYELNLSVSQVVEFVDGSDVYLIGTLPDITLIELLKSVAAMSGTSLNYKEGVGITFENIDFDSWAKTDVSKVTKIGTIQRKFSDYAQTNIVKFQSSGEMFGGEKKFLKYMIENDNIDAENTLLEIPFSECALYFVNGIEVAFIRNNEDGNTDEWSLMNANADSTDSAPTSTLMTRVSLKRNNAIDTLCYASTSIVVSCRMTQYEYEQVNEKTRLLFNGTLYVWTSAKWSNDTAEFTLAKI